MDDTPLKDMSISQIRKLVTWHLVQLSEWQPGKEADAVAAVDVLRTHTVRCLAAMAMILGRHLDKHPRA